MSIIAKASTVGNNIKTIDFNGQPLLTIERDGIHYTAVKPIAENIGLTWDSQFRRIKRDDVLSSVVAMMAITGNDGKTYEMMCLPIDYLNGWLFGIDAKRVKPEIKAPLIQYKMQCYKVLHDYWHTGQAIHPSVNEELPSTVKDRNGLVKAAKITQYKLGIGYDDVFSLIHHRFNIDKLGDLTQKQVGEATEYIQRMRYPQLAEPVQQSDYEQITNDTVYGNTAPMIQSPSSATKFIAQLDSTGRMTMREMQSDEFVTTMQKLPDILHASDQTDLVAISRLGVKVSQILLCHSGYVHPEVARLSGGSYER